jgi:uncharacterized protein (TIGR00255 family)
MTGYGQARWQGGGFVAFAEVRSVNGKHFKLAARLPHELAAAEHDIEKLVRKHISRGSVDLYVKVERTGAQAAVPLNKEALASYIRQLQDVGQRLGTPIAFSGDALLGLPGVLEAEEFAFEGAAGLLERVHETIAQALEALDRMRQVEGANLRRELLSYGEVLERGVADLEAAHPEALDLYRQRLTARINRMLEDRSLCVTEQDLAREIAIFTERSAICEEIARLRSHVQQFREALDQDRPVGRRLDFIGQEMNREVNTMGAKVADAALSRLVGVLRVEVDKIREQVLNVE